MKTNNLINSVTLLSSIAFISSLSFASIAQAGEGGIAGSAAFTVTGDKVVGVAVSAAVGKENAVAGAFNYDATNASGLQNSAFAMGSAGVLTLTTIGAPTGFGVAAIEDQARGTIQTNTFTAGTVNIQLGTVTGNTLVDAP